MLDTQNFQPHSGEPVENQIVLEIIHAPRSDIFQIFAWEFSQAAFQRLQGEAVNRPVNRFQKSKGGIWAVFQNALEVTAGVQLGIVSDKYFNPVHAAEA